MEKYEIVKFVDNEFELDVRTDKENDTVWLIQEEMSKLFGVDRTRITRHINNIYNEGELDKNSTCAENAQVQFEGNRNVTRKIRIYNLDMIIAIGYRVRSNVGTTFRIWATNTLNEYVTKGIVLNDNILK